MRTVFIILFTIVVASCHHRVESGTSKSDSAIACIDSMPARLSAATDTAQIKSGTFSKEGMVWVPGGEYMMGATDDEGRPDEYPSHKVTVKGF